MEQYKKIVSFHPFEANIISDVFKREVEIYNNTTINSIQETIFIGICAGNINKTKLGDFFLVDRVVMPDNSIISLSTINNYIPLGSCKSSNKPYFLGDVLETDIYDMELYKIVQKFGTNINMVRIVTDFGIDKNKKFNLNNYKKEIYKTFVDALYRLKSLI